MWFGTVRLTDFDRISHADYRNRLYRDGGTMNVGAAEANAAPIEVHSIDYIPIRERHGHVRDQFTLWFLGNAELATLVVGFIGISLGLNLFWCLVAILLGEVFGTFFMAFHSVQGP